MAVSVIREGNRSTQRKRPTCRKSLTNLSHNIVVSSSNGGMPIVDLQMNTRHKILYNRYTTYVGLMEWGDFFSFQIHD
jgi:hypothetical protein